MLNRRSLMITTILVSATGASVENVCAQCAITDCEVLGYTEAYNSVGNCLKCPFGEAYICEAGYICPEGYDYTCSGTGYAGGAGSACNGKYISCNCTDSYKWENGSCEENKAEFGQCSGYAAQCSLGDILFSDGTCNANTVLGKTPIAVVVYISDYGCGQAIALKSLGSYAWGQYDTIGFTENISSLKDYTSRSTASQDYASCENSAKIRNHGNSSIHPAVWAANEYSTEGTNAGDWCLPAAGIFTSIYNNQSVINTGFSRAGGTQFTNSTSTWSSSEYKADLAWISIFSYSYGLDMTNKTNGYQVRPVIEF